MWPSLLLLAFLAPCLYTVVAEDQCGEQDPTVYLFGYGHSWGPYEYLNDDGELMGLGYDVTRSVCKVMNKKCEHAVFYDYSYMWDSQGKSTALNDGWYAAAVNWIPTPRREAAYHFFAEFASEPAAFMFVRSNDRDDTKEEVMKDADKFGFRKGFRLSADCLGEYLGMSLTDKAVEYDDAADLQAALADGKVDVIFMDEIDVIDKSTVKRIPTEPISCASAGVCVMARKDKAAEFAWYEEGLAKIRANGDYEWVCNMNTNGIEPGCN